RLLTREPAEPAIDPGAGRQLGDALHSYIAVRGGDDLRGVDGSLERARGQEVQRGNELFQPQGDPLHLAPSLGREGPARVALVRPCVHFAIFGDGVPDDHQTHRPRASGRRARAISTTRTRWLADSVIA